MGKNLQNSLVAGIVYLSAVALLYGFTDTVPLGKGIHKMEAAHWGAGVTARQTQNHWKVGVGDTKPSLRLSKGKPLTVVPPTNEVLALQLYELE